MSNDNDNANDGVQQDDELAAELARALRNVNPLIEQVSARARQSFSWRTVDSDLLLAGLSFDSAVDAPGDLVSSGLRSDPASQSTGGRVLIFTDEVQLLSVEVEVLSDRLVGQFVPPGAGLVTVETDQGQALDPAEVDDQGFFIVEPVPRGLVRLRCEHGGNRIISTWVRL